MLERKKRMDQANRLREQVEQHENDKESEMTHDQALPSRASIHKNKNQKKKAKLSFPLIRLLLMLFILLVIAAVTSPYWLD